MILSVDLTLLQKAIEQKNKCEVELLAINIQDVNGNFEVIFRADTAQRTCISQKEYYEFCRTKKIDDLFNNE